MRIYDSCLECVCKSVCPHYLGAEDASKFVNGTRITRIYVREKGYSGKPIEIY